MKLIHDDHVEVVRRDLIDTRGVEALDRCEDMLEIAWAITADPLLTKRGVPQNVSKGRNALVEDLFTVSDEQQPRPRQVASQPRVVDRGHDRLACAGGSDQQVAMTVVKPSDGKQFEQPLLEWSGGDLDRAQDGCGPASARSGGARLFVELDGLVLDEIAVRPIRIERADELVDDGLVSSG